MSAQRRKRTLIFGGALALIVILAASGLFLRSCARQNRYERYFERAEAAYRAGDWDEAVENLEKAMAVDATEECYLLLADVYYYGKDDLEQAIDVLYVGSYKLGTEAIAQRLEELKAEKTRRDEDSEDKATIGGRQYGLETTTLSLAKLGLKDEDILELSRLVYLQCLTLTDNEISDLSPLAALTRLTALYAADNNIRDLGPLSGLTLLKTLYLDNNPIGDLSPLYALRNLTTLSLKGVEITEEALAALQEALPDCSIFTDGVINEAVEITLGGVTFMSDVEELDLGGLGLTDISELAKCEKLKKLDLRNNSVSDLSPLTELTELEWLCVWNNKVSDIRPLMSLTKLAYLDADSNQIKDIGTLGALTKLEELWLSYNPLSDIGPLSKLTGLTRLGLKGTGLEDGDLDSLTGLTKLQELLLQENTELTGNRVDALKAALPGCAVSHSDLLYTLALGGKEYRSDATEIDAPNAGVSDLAGLEKFTKLVRLYLSDNLLTNISPLSGLTGLETLDLRNNGVSNLSPLSGLTSLRALDLAENSVTDLSALSGLTALSELHLDYNRPGSLSALSGLTNLSKLTLAYCSLEDIGALAGLKNLTYLDLEGNSISDIAALTGLAKLQTLRISNNNFTSTQIRQLMEALPGCQIITDVAADTPQPSGRPG